MAIIMKYGNWTILRELENHYVLAQCSCGDIHERYFYSLRSGASRQCRKCGSTYHKQSRTRLYYIWHGMLGRCYNSNTVRYSSYGGKGVKVCKDWHDFNKFAKWAHSAGYTDELTIDRLNVNDNYCPENCRWTTHKENSSQGNVWLLGSDGAMYKGFKVLSEELGININTLYAKVRDKKVINNVSYTYCNPAKYV